MSKKTTLEFKLDDSTLDEYELDAIEAMWKTAEALHTNLVQSETMPFLSGHLQNTATRAEPVGNRKRAKVYKLISDTEYAHRLHENPDYNFNKEENSNAGAGWMNPYIKGDKKHLILDYFLIFAKKE